MKEGKLELPSSERQAQTSPGAGVQLRGTTSLEATLQRDDPDFQLRTTAVAALPSRSFRIVPAPTRLILPPQSLADIMSQPKFIRLRATVIGEALLF